VVKDTDPREITVPTWAPTWRMVGTCGAGTRAPFFDGVNDYVNLYSASLAADFNGEAGSFLICKFRLRVSDRWNFRF
jgi:hypothetical protein